MIHSIWNDVCQQPTLAANHQHYEKHVSDSTAQLQQCISNILALLDDRASVLTRCVNFAAALRDATAMQEISPMSPLGYLRAATIYSEQGKQQDAITSCYKGLNALDINDPGYSKLEETRLVATQRTARRIDFISQLPLDIVLHVLFPMLMGDDNDDGVYDDWDLCPYLDVSRMWFERLFQACSGEFHFKLNTNRPSNRITRYAQHTMTLRINSYSLGNWYSDFLRDANLCSLWEIKITGLHAIKDVDYFVSSLKSVGNTLTQLTIMSRPSRPFAPRSYFTDTANEPQPPLRIADILINCPHLVTLHITYRFDIDFSAVPLTKTWPQLTMLFLSHRNSDISNGQFVAMLKRLPSLYKLVLYPCIETQPMTTIQRYCPSMRELELVTKRTESSPARLEHQHDDQWIHEGAGLKRITLLEDTQQHDAWIDMSETLKQHHNTLVHLRLRLDYAGNNDHEIFSLEYPCLKALNLQINNLNNVCFGWWIIEKAPLLEELKITADVIRLNPVLLNFTPPPTLRKLVMHLYGVTRPDDVTVIERFLGCFNQQKEGCSIKHLALRFDNRGGDDVTPDILLPSISQLDQLQHLGILYSPIEPTLWMFDDFILKLVKACPNLLSLETDNDISSRAYVIKDLKRFQHLRHITFRMDATGSESSKGEWDDSNQWYAFGTFSQLRSIRVWSYGEVNHVFIRYLKAHRPDINVVAL
ncbi:hypothetical protein O0I10_011978 [Lichtheimia ornata]|uniref:F-box domain-containing protein n=1 Tax=Lichtheimia ornata TaxID=688661 RepID=A0AAD7URU2_9FUNG|nr:uncharacterized protein O0I10_011978 [Lichtheimia ornata]KAJ8652398.1 hypothetical protein O0I10_011978 [Lichtheimia ornata]